MNYKKLLTGMGIISTLVPAAYTQQKPNVVFFLVDDLGWKDISANGSKLYETPHIDEVMNESVYFSNAYAAFPRCVPSRYAMMTGRHPARNSETNENRITGKETTLGEAMQNNGYGTFFAGKWHLGHTEEFWPQNQGFDVNKGGCDAGSPGSYFFPYGSDKFKNHDLYGLEEGKKGEYITDRLTDETIKYIREHRDGPFFVYLAHYAVHTPFQAKPDRVEYYREKIKKMSFKGKPYTFGPDGRAKMWQDNAVYAAMVESMDESFGKIVATLKELGIYDNTIIIFTSDHGGLSNSGINNKRELATSNLPLRAGKGHLYEGGIKVPVFVRWPGVTKPGSTSDVIIDGMDYYPTILEMCGLPLLPDQHIDGVSFAPALRGEPMNKDRIFYWHQDNSRPESTGDHNSSVIRKGPWKLQYFLDNGVIELYNLDKDPYESNNLADKKPELVKELMKMLEEWKVEAHVKSPEREKNSNVGAPGKANRGTPHQPGELINGDFESGVENGWSLNTRKGAEASLFETDNASGGEKAALITVNEADKLPFVVLESDKISYQETNYLVTFSAMANENKTPLKVQIKYSDAKGEPKYNASAFTLKKKYKSYSFIAKPKSDFDARKLQIRFQCGTPGADYYIDDVKIEPLEN